MDASMISLSAGLKKIEWSNIKTIRELKIAATRYGGVAELGKRQEDSG